MEKFGEVLRAARGAKGMTQQQLAKSAGTSSQRISNLEQGLRQNPSWETVQKLADALGVPTDQLRTLAPKKNSKKIGNTD